MSASRELVPPLLLGVLATAICLNASWSVSFWTDEAAVISAATRSLPDLFALLGTVDAVHGAHYVFAHFWIDLFGASPFSLRLPSAIAAGVAAVGTYTLARLLTDRRTAVIAGLVFCVLPRVTWMGIEARSFSFSAAVAAWLGVVLVLGLRGSHVDRPHRARGHWIGYAALVAAGIALNIYVALVVLAHGVTILLVGVSRATRVAWLLAACVGGAVASPVVWFSVHERGQLGQPPLGIVYFMRSTLVNNWFLGDTPTVGSSRGGPSELTGGGEFAAWQVCAVLLALICWSFILLAVVRARRVPSPPERPAIPVASIVLPWLLLPVGLVGIVSFAATPMFNARYFTFGVAAAAIGVAAGIATLAPKWTQVLATVLIAVTALPVYQSQRTPFAKSGSDWGAVAELLTTDAQEGDGVFYCPTSVTAPGAPALTKKRRISIAYPEAFQGLIDVTETSASSEPRLFPDESIPLEAALDRVSELPALWVICPADYPEETADADHALLTNAGLTPTTSWRGRTTFVTRYSRD